MGGTKHKNKQDKQQKKKHAKQEQHQTQQQAKQQERQSKRQMKREKNKFNKAKYESDMTKFRLQLAQYGLKVKDITGDGNCLFRAIADQLEGLEHLHRKYRNEAVDYIEIHKEDYKFFIEDDETIDQYLGDMAKDSVWGGQLELQVLSLIYKFNYIVHQVDNPIMAFSNFPWGTVPTLHISYHLGEHYNSVRLLEDPCKTGEPATLRPIGHELKPREVVLQIEKEILIDQNPTIKEETANYNEVPRDELIAYALMQCGYTDPGLMGNAINDCFGKDEPLSYQNIEQVLGMLREIYEKYEVEQLSTTLETKLTLNGQEETKQDAPPKTDLELLKALQKEDVIISTKGELSPMPSKNKKCPCNSRKNYKNCECYAEDLQRKTQWIEKLTKKIEANTPKQNSILLL